MTSENGVLFTAALILILILLLLYLGTRKPHGYPPGPRWWPILGSALEVAKLRRETGVLFDACNKLGEKYGPIIGLKIGSDKIVMLNTYEGLKAMTLNEYCDGRPINPVYKVRTFGERRGVLVTDGQVWQEQRRFVLRHLREFGFGRTNMSELIEEEAHHMVEHFKKLLRGDVVTSSELTPSVKEEKPKNGVKKSSQIYKLMDSEKKLKEDCDKEEDEVPKKVNPTIDNIYVKAESYEDVVEASNQMSGTVVQMQDAFGVPILNTLWRMMAGKRYSMEDKELVHLQKILTSLFRDLDMIGCAFGHFPFLRFIAPERSGYNIFLRIHQKLWAFIQNELQNHKKTYDPTVMRDLMDYYLQALENKERGEPIGETFSEKQLLSICVDLFMAGSETTAKALSFCFLYMVLYPEVQKKAQKEIDAVLGRDRFPTLNDRPSMPYVSAIVLESLRMFMGRTMNIPHRAMKDTTLLGYRIPKDTMIVVNFNRVLMNEEIWDQPKRFMPERFIDKEGKVFMPDHFLPFSFGKHRCMGEVLAKSNIFVIIAALLQTFSFSTVPGEDKPKDEFVDGVTASPKPYRVLVNARM